MQCFYRDVCKQFSWAVVHIYSNERTARVGDGVAAGGGTPPPPTPPPEGPEAEGASVGALVGAADGSADGSAVGANVGLAVGEGVSGGLPNTPNNVKWHTGKRTEQLAETLGCSPPGQKEAAGVQVAFSGL